jgi:hypothetical protein
MLNVARQPECVSSYHCGLHRQGGEGYTLVNADVRQKRSENKGRPARRPYIIVKQNFAIPFSNG